jgi:hypothetical protein
MVPIAPDLSENILSFKKIANNISLSLKLFIPILNINPYYEKKIRRNISLINCSFYVLKYLVIEIF